MADPLVVHEDVAGLEHDTETSILPHRYVQRFAVAALPRFNLGAAYPALDDGDKIDLQAGGLRDVYELSSLGGESLRYRVLRTAFRFMNVFIEHLCERGLIITRDQNVSVQHVRFEHVDGTPLTRRADRIVHLFARQCYIGHEQPAQGWCKDSNPIDLFPQASPFVLSDWFGVSTFRI